MREATVLCLTCKKRRSLGLMETDITCKRCMESVAEENRTTIEGRVSARTHRLHQRRLSIYGITPAVFAAMKRQQGGACAICRRVPLGPRGLVIDHNHATNEVRGLLCSACNSGVGLFHDDPARLAAAIDYLNVRGHYAHLRRVVGGEDGVPTVPTADSGADLR